MKPKQTEQAEPTKQEKQVVHPMTLVAQGTTVGINLALAGWRWEPVSSGLFLLIALLTLFSAIGNASNLKEKLKAADTPAN